MSAKPSDPPTNAPMIAAGDDSDRRSSCPAAEDPSGDLEGGSGGGGEGAAIASTDREGGANII